MEELLQKFLLSQSDNRFLIETLKQRINELEARVPSNDLILENAKNNALVIVLKDKIKYLEEKYLSYNSLVVENAKNNALVIVLKDRIKELEEKDLSNNSLIVEQNALVMVLKDRIKELEEKYLSNNSHQQNVLLSDSVANMNNKLETLSALNPPSSSKPVVKQMTLADGLLEEGIAQYRGDLIDALTPHKQRERLIQSDFNPKAHTFLRAYCNSAANILGNRIHAPSVIADRQSAKCSFIRCFSLTTDESDKKTSSEKTSKSTKRKKDADSDVESEKKTSKRSEVNKSQGFQLKL